MASKKKVEVKIQGGNIVNVVMDDEKFDKLIDRLTTLINFADGANEAVCNLKATLATVSVL